MPRPQDAGEAGGGGVVQAGGLQGERAELGAGAALEGLGCRGGRSQVLEK